MKGRFMKKYLFLVLIFLFSAFSFGAGKKEEAQILMTATKDHEYNLIVAVKSKDISVVMVQWIKEDSLKKGAVIVLFENEKGDSKEIKGDFSNRGPNMLTFSPGDTAKEFIKNSKKIILLIQDKNGNKSEKIEFDVTELGRDLR